MPIEDRVLTTTWLVDVNDSGYPWAQISPAILKRLAPLGMHTVVPAGELHRGDDSLVCCELVLDICDADEPIVVAMLLPTEDFESLPTAFQVLRAAGQLVPQVVAATDSDLCLLRDSDGDL